MIVNPKKIKHRLDHLLVSRGLAENPSKARALIMAGEVIVAEHRVDKPGQKFAEDVVIRVREAKIYVSRGALKLEHALKHWGITVKDMIAIDVGASSGGFTEVLLHNKVKLVYAVDVGHGQLAMKIRYDDRVVVLEKMHILDLKPSVMRDKPNIAVIDVSFISLTKILHHVVSLLSDQAVIIALIKPQFEAGPSHVDKGIVRDPHIHDMVINNITKLVNDLGLKIIGIEPSPILGAKGNKEFLIALNKV